MGRLRVLSGSRVVDILEQNGFRSVRQRGRPAALQRRDGTFAITVIVPLHRELRTGTLLSIVRQSKLDRALFEA